MGADFRYQSSNKDLSAFLTLGFAFDRSPLDGSLRFGSDAATDRGTLRAVPFVDRDQDGLRGPDEAAVRGANISLNPRRQSQKGEEATLFSALPTGQTVTLTVDGEELEDPFIAAPPRAYEISLRPGQVVDVQLPMVEVGEAVVGVVVDGEAKSGQIVTLLANRDGTRLRSRTAFDGQAFFNAVPQGEYTIVMDRVEMGTIVVEARNVARTTVRTTSPTQQSAPDESAP